jgi:plastocyanin
VRAPLVLPRMAAALATGILAVALAGCGSNAATGSGASAAPAGATSAAAPGSSPDTPAGTLTATESEYKIDLSSADLTPGSYTITVANAGRSTHSLTIQGPGGVDVTSDIVQGGKSTTMTVTLQPGEYEVFCPIGNHRQMGMDTTLRVS